MERYFIPGDEWLYFKIYAGYSSIDLLLSNEINKIATVLIEEDVVSKWFFIRYNDPEPHLRLRFNLDSNDSISTVIAAVNGMIKPYIKSRLVFKVQIDTYVREINRYPPKIINEIESLFCVDSTMVSSFLSRKIPDKNMMVRWSFALCSINQLLNSFGLSLNEKYDLLVLLDKSFDVEFQKNSKFMKQQLAQKFRECRNVVNDSVSNKLPIEIIEIIEERSSKLTLIIELMRKEIGVSLSRSVFTQLIPSIIHMNFNRIFLSRQRQYEMLSLDFLKKTYESEIWLKRKNGQLKDPAVEGVYL